MSTAQGTTASEAHALAAAAALLADGRPREAIDGLVEANRTLESPAVYVQLVQLRHQAFAHLTAPQTPETWPGAVVDHFPDVRDVPSIAPADLTLDTLRAGVLAHGSLIVRGLLPQQRVERLRDDIDRSIEGFDRAAEHGFELDDPPWYARLDPNEGYSFGLTERIWTRQLGGMLAAEAPRTLQDTIDAFDEAGIRPLLTAYLGEPPALSVKKTTLRRAPAGAPTGWHQDGSFLGDGIRTINAWVALSHCGVDAPGLDIVPRRLATLVETGTGTANFDWAVGPEEAERVAAGTTVTPVFAPGDAVFFDQLTLHRTAVTPSMTQTRYAIESWFFAASTYPHEQIPLLF